MPQRATLSKVLPNASAKRAQTREKVPKLMSCGLAWQSGYRSHRELSGYSSAGLQERDRIVKNLKNYRPAARIFDVIKQGQTQYQVTKVLTPAAGNVSLDEKRRF